MLTRKARSKKSCKYAVTKRDRYYLRKYKKGKSIGFTMKSSLKAKGLIARSSGKKIISPKYCN